MCQDIRERETTKIDNEVLLLCCSDAAVVGKSVAGIDDPKTIATRNHGVVADLFV